MTTVAALYVDAKGCYVGLEGVDPWDQARDARLYAGPHPVIAHPPCQRWGRMWFGSPSGKERFEKGADGGCFAAALASVRKWGGVLEHPAGTAAWAHHGIARPPAAGGWIMADMVGGWTCQVAQSHYGHRARKDTWLYAHGTALPSMVWGPGVATLVRKGPARGGPTQRANVVRRREGVEMMNHKERIHTPPAFMELLLSIARSARTNHG